MFLESLRKMNNRFVLITPLHTFSGMTCHTYKISKYISFNNIYGDTIGQVFGLPIPPKKEIYIENILYVMQQINIPRKFKKDV